MPEHKYSWVEHPESSEGLHDDVGGEEDVVRGGSEKLQQDRGYDTVNNDSQNEKEQGDNKGHREHGQEDRRVECPDKCAQGEGGPLPEGDRGVGSQMIHHLNLYSFYKIAFNK